MLVEGLCEVGECVMARHHIGLALQGGGGFNFGHVYPDSSKTREKFLVFFGLADSARRMIRGGFLTQEDRGKLVALVRDGSAASRVTRRANALVLLDGDGAVRKFKSLRRHRRPEGRNVNAGVFAF
jgi:hypothetical protein